jgi:hypothetical protein
MNGATRFGGAVVVALAAVVAGCGGSGRAIAARGPSSSEGSRSDASVASGVKGAAPSGPSSEGAWGVEPVAPAPRAPAEARSAPGAGEAFARDDAGPAWEPAPSRPSLDPGLGTSWGETRTSHVSTAPFFRADPERPLALGSLFYNDDRGARAMSQASAGSRWGDGSIELEGGVATVRLRDGSGRFLSGLEAADRTIVVGEHDQRYTIVVDSHVPARLEVVVSVDGLDVLDGRPAGVDKRGYLLEPNGRLEIDGFRQNFEEVAAFRFGSVRDSYAEKKHGDTRNVGVIGVAVFHEQGSNPWALRNPRRRLDANPFPGSFATPPSR